MRWIVAAFNALVGLLCAAAATQAETGDRLALVIGNANYRYLPRLENPANDARLIAETLKGLGFTLVAGKEQTDLDRAGFERAIREFGAELVGRRVGLVYYAGHGLQLRGVNYLVPTSANPATVADVDFELIDAGLVLKQMETAGSRLNIVILDACRNNPFGGRGLRDTGAGLAQIQAPNGTLISYATQPGSVALDGTAGHSPYTLAVAEAMRRPGLSVLEVFNAAGLTVEKTTAGKQQPWVSSSPLEGNFYFLAPATANGLPPAPTSGPPTDTDVVFWQSIATSSNPADFEEYLRHYPQGRFAGLAGNRLTALRPPPGASGTYDDETRDFGLAPVSTIRTSEYDAPTPLSVTGAKTISTLELRGLMSSPRPPLLIDVIGGNQTVSLPNAFWMKDAGLGSSLSDDFQPKLAFRLAALTGSDRSRAVVFFDLSKTSWLSYNAIVRAAALGYTNLYWYRGGRNAWQAAGLSMAPVTLYTPTWPRILVSPPDSSIRADLARFSGIWFGQWGSGRYAALGVKNISSDGTAAIEYWWQPRRGEDLELRSAKLAKIENGVMLFGTIRFTIDGKDPRKAVAEAKDGDVYSVGSFTKQ